MAHKVKRFDIVVVGSIIIIFIAYNILNIQDTSNDISSESSDTQQTHMDNNTTADLKIEILVPGSGVEIQSGQIAIVHYTGMLTDGKVFDSSIPRGETFPVHLGAGEVIRGWDLGLVGMKVGEKRKLTIPSALAYGPGGIPGVIPPDATLIFEVTLEAIQ